MYFFSVGYEFNRTDYLVAQMFLHLPLTKYMNEIEERKVKDNLRILMELPYFGVNLTKENEFWMYPTELLTELTEDV